MFIKPFKKLLQEFKPKEDLSFTGVVVDNLDPLKLCRVRVRISLYEDLDVELIPWARPELPFFLGLSSKSIMCSVPEVGSWVDVKFKEKDKKQPTYCGTAPNLKNICNFFSDDEDYPNVYGFIDSVNNFFRINKIKKTIQVRHSSSSNVLFNENGSLKAVLADGTVIEADVIAHNVSISCSNKIIMNCKDLEVNASENVLINTPIITIDGEEVVTGNIVAPDVIVSDKSVNGHAHGGVDSGSSNTSPF